MNNDLDEYIPLTRKESIRFWSIFGAFMLLDLSLILLIDYGLSNGWYA